MPLASARVMFHLRAEIPSEEGVTVAMGEAVAMGEEENDYDMISNIINKNRYDSKAIVDADDNISDDK